MAVRGAGGRGAGRHGRDQWPVTMRLDDFTALLHEAGYGTAPGTDLEDMRAERGRGRESLRPGLRGATARQAGYGTKED